MNEIEEPQEVEIESGENNPYVRAVKFLNQAFDHFNELYCEGNLKRPLITILSRGRKACLGWHWKNKWSYQDSLHTEIMVAAEALQRPLEDILETLLHEMVHLWNSTRDIKDCNAAQYHNKHFKKAAEDVFHLQVDKMPQRGYALTSLTIKSQGDVRNFLDTEKIEDFRLSRVQEEGRGPVKKQYMINVSQEDYEWFRSFKRQENLKSKDAFSLLRDEYELANTLEERKVS
jgi:hypothetical protein